MLHQNYTGKSFLSDFQTPRSGLKKRGAADFFLNQLRAVPGNEMSV